MMCNRKRKSGRFGISQAATSVAAVAILAVSPAVVSLADSRLEGVALTVAEAVFGEPVCAQSSDCVDRNGNRRPCTVTETTAQWRRRKMHSNSASTTPRGIWRLCVGLR